MKRRRQFVVYVPRWMGDARHSWHDTFDAAMVQAARLASEGREIQIDREIHFKLFGNHVEIAKTVWRS